jgi:diadenosine tetraphosphate (Ap4A) HIT family hydrolase
VEVAALPGARGCLPCALLASQRLQSDCLAQSAYGAVFVNRFACRERHLLVLARRHVEHIHQLSAEEHADLQRLAFRAAVALEACFHPVRIYTAVLGSAAPLPMSYPHLHVHVVPVMDSDERARPARVFTWSEGVILYDEADVLALAAELRPHWPAEADR